MVVVLILTHAAAFAIGGLVFRNNAKAANADIANVQSAASNVASAASNVAAAVKKV